VVDSVDGDDSDLHHLLLLLCRSGCNALRVCLRAPHMDRNPALLVLLAATSIVLGGAGEVDSRRVDAGDADTLVPAVNGDASDDDCSDKLRLLLLYFFDLHRSDTPTLPLQGPLPPLRSTPAAAGDGSRTASCLYCSLEKPCNITAGD